MRTPVEERVHIYIELALWNFLIIFMLSLFSEKKHIYLSEMAHVVKIL